MGRSGQYLRKSVHSKELSSEEPAAVSKSDKRRAAHMAESDVKVENRDRVIAELSDMRSPPSPGKKSKK